MLLDLATIVVLGSGLYLWLVRRRPSVEADIAETELDNAHPFPLIVVVYLPCARAALDAGDHTPPPSFDQAASTNIASVTTVPVFGTVRKHWLCTSFDRRSVVMASAHLKGGILGHSKYPTDAKAPCRSGRAAVGCRRRNTGASRH
jgi:hypothetical protein